MVAVSKLSNNEATPYPYVINTYPEISTDAYAPIEIVSYVEPTLTPMSWASSAVYTQQPASISFILPATTVDTEHMRWKQENGTPPGLKEETNPFRRAQMLLAIWGWTQGSYLKESGEMCLSGALRQGQQGYVQWRETCAMLHSLLGTEPAMAGEDRGVVAWNDTAGRSKEDVCRLLDRAARQWDNVKGQPS